MVKFNINYSNDIKIKTKKYVIWHLSKTFYLFFKKFTITI